LVSINVIGSAESVINAQLLAQAPAAPTVAPVQVTVSSTSVIRVSWTAVVDDGFSEITSYSLEMDDGQGGDFKPVVGHLSDFLGLSYTITSNVTKGTLYRF
jgi:hypothetical protein